MADVARSPARDVPTQSGSDGFDRRRAARHGRLEPRAGSPARGRSASRRARRACTCSTRPIRPRSRAVTPRRHARSTSWPASRARRSSRTRWRRISSARLERRRHRQWARSLRRHHRSRAPSWRRARAARTLPRRVHQPRRHRRPLLGAVVLRHGAGGAHGPGRRSASSDWGRAMLDEAQPDGAGRDESRPSDSALLMAPAAEAGRDKLTLIVPPSLEAFGLWVEQLVAESTGKQRRRRRADCRRDAWRADSYGDDRLFVRLRTRRDDGRGRGVTGRCSALGDAPLATIDASSEPAALGAEFVRWEIATAVAGGAARDQSVRRAERAAGQGRDARACSTATRSIGALPTGADRRHAKTASRSRSATAARQRLGRTSRRHPDAARLGRLPRRCLAYLGPDPSLARVLQAFRMAVRDEYREPRRCSGTGPRYLHSTGQLHKGGPNSGVFVLITATAVRRLRHSRQAVLVRHARAGAGDSAISRRSKRPAGVPSTSTCRRRIAALGAANGRWHDCTQRPVTALASDGACSMQLGFVGLGKMGLNMVTRLARGGHHVVAFDRSAGCGRQRAQAAGAAASRRSSAASRRSPPPRAVWVMVPAGDATESTVAALGALLVAPATSIIDGGNTNFHDDVRRAADAGRQGHRTTSTPARAAASGASRKATA